VTVSLDGIDTVIFDKDGTLIDFHAMWSGWAESLAADLERATGHELRALLFGLLGYDAQRGQVRAGGLLSATPMARLRDSTATMLMDNGLDAAQTEAALRSAWRSPDPVTLAHPCTDLPALLGALRASGRRVAIVTSDDRVPTEQTIAALGIADLVDACVCADDGIPTKPAPDAVLHVSRLLGGGPDRAVVIGDAPADIEMGRRAGAGLVLGVRTGVGSTVDLAAADHVLGSVQELLAAI
jgi:phosphoglycolate phosphatase